jgi:uncharacterized protein
MRFSKVQIDKVNAACRLFKVRHLYVFGSYISDDFSDTSDVDFLVEFIRDGFAGAFDQYLGLKAELESIVGRNVDLVCLGSILNPIFKLEAAATREIVYAA